jgi:Fe-S cluster biogenesis protein NfuA
VRETVEGVVRDVLRPLIEADGGTLELVDVRDALVIVRLGGIYRGCPSAPYTLQAIIEPAVKRAMGDKVRVELVV